MKLSFDASGVEFVHSSEIIEFFWFFPVFFLMVHTALRIFKYKENFSAEETQSKSPVVQKGYNQAPEIKASQNQFERASENQEDKVALDDIHISNAQSDQHHLGSPEINLEQGIVNIPQQQQQQRKKGSLGDFMENLIFRYMPFLGITIINIVTFGSYIFLAFMTVFWFFIILLFNYLEIFSKYGVESLQMISEFFHILIVFSMFINYFVNDQSQI